jgi:hypothetical protein
MNMKRPGAKPKHMKRPNFSKGGMIKKIAGRSYFDDGGGVSGPSVTTGTGSVNATQGIGGAGGFGGIGGVPSQITGGLPSWAQSGIGLVNSFNPFTQLQNATTNNFQASGAPLQAGTNAQELNSAYGQAQGGLGAQQSFAGALSGQGAQGMNTQGALTGQLQGVINGTGPNAAQAALNQNTAQNVANQQAAAAGQRGASSNVGLMERNAALQGANAQQQAVGQAATLQAQQQLAAQGQLQNLAANQINQQGQAISGVNTSAQNEQNTLQGANTALNNANVGMQSNLNNVNSTTAQGNQASSNGLIGGLLNGASSIVSSILSKGGVVGRDGKKVVAVTFHPTHMVHHYDGGGSVNVNFDDANYSPVPSESSPNIGSMNPTNEAQAWQSGGSKGGGVGGAIAGLAALMAKGGNVCNGPHQSHVANFLAQGGAVPAMVSAGERYLGPDDVKRVVEQGDNPLKLGHEFKGKAKVKGDSLKNDTIPATLEEGGVVIPRHVMNKKSRDHAELFVRRAVHMKSPKGAK